MVGVLAAAFMLPYIF